jgi:beta-lactamase regulating signal transducer with metallopeptidase domain
MTTATHDPKQAGHGKPGAAPRPAPHDPEHDIDARTVALWVIGWAVVLFLALYFMLPLFDRVLQQERARKIDHLPAEELENVRDAERTFLRGEESQSKKSIDQVIDEMAKNK